MRICSKLLRLEKVHLQARIVVLLILKLPDCSFQRWTMVWRLVLGQLSLCTRVKIILRGMELSLKSQKHCFGREIRPNFFRTYNVEGVF
jgi:hypothetical protein